MFQFLTGFNKDSFASMNPDDINKFRSMHPEDRMHHYDKNNITLYIGIAIFLIIIGFFVRKHFSRSS